MRRRRGSSQPPEMAAALKRVEHWRRTRKKRRPMPEDLWEEAASVARIHGVHMVSRVLRLNYNDLKKRAGQMPQKGHNGERRPPSGFVELRAAELLQGSGAQEAIVELSDGDGGQLTVRLTGYEKIDVPSLVQAFWRRQG